MKGFMKFLLVLILLVASFVGGYIVNEKNLLGLKKDSSKIAYDDWEKALDLFNTEDDWCIVQTYTYESTSSITQYRKDGNIISKKSEAATYPTYYEKGTKSDDEYSCNEYSYKNGWTKTTTSYTWDSGRMGPDGARYFSSFDFNDFIYDETNKVYKGTSTSIDGINFTLTFKNNKLIEYSFTSGATINCKITYEKQNLTLPTVSANA